MIADTIRKLRMERSFTQEYIAFELGISQNAYCKIENGQVQLTIGRLQKIAVILNIPLAALFAKDDASGPPGMEEPLCQELKEVILVLRDELQAKQKVVDGLLDIIRDMQEEKK